MPEPRSPVRPRHVRILPALAVAAALLASLGSPSPAAGDAIEAAEEASRAERDRLLVELTAIRTGLLPTVASCRQQADRALSTRVSCSRAEGRLRKAIALESDLRTAPDTAVSIDRALASERLGEWRDALERLRAESARVQGRRAAHTPAAAAPPPGDRIAAGSLGAIAGLVTDAMTGQPIADIFIEVYDGGGSFAAFAVTDLAGDYATPDSLPAGTYFVRAAGSGNYIAELYDDIPCASFCDVTSGTPVAVTGGGTTSGIDFALDPGGVITGTVTEDDTGNPIVNASVLIWDSLGNFVTSAGTDSSGVYTSSAGLPTGTYFATTDNQSSYLNELYDDLSCPFFCDPTNGTPIAVTQGSTTAGIDFALDAGGAISGTVTEDGTGDPLTAFVVIFDGFGGFATFGFTDGAGSYVSTAGLPTGTYFARSDVLSLHLNELYDDIPCPFFECDPATGMPIAVTVGTTTPGIDFALPEGGGVAGTVTDETTGGPIPSVQVGILDGAGDLREVLFSDSAGDYSSFSGMPAGSYRARTLNAQNIGYANEVFDGLQCLQVCPVTQGTSIPVTVGTLTAGVDFSLPVRPLFFDGLESGGLGFWSDVTGGVGCAHSMCTTGGPLLSACDPCAVAVCAVDASCCNVGWDDFCVIEVTTVCGLECP